MVKIIHAKLTVSLSSFLAILEQAEKFDSRYPVFSQTAWMISNWDFDDRQAHYRARGPPLIQFKDIFELTKKTAVGER